MKYLAIDTSGDNLTVIINDQGKYYKYFDEKCGVKHSETLMVKVEELLTEANVKLKDLDFLCTVVGAGSFTGIRIGVSTVKAMCFANNVKALAVTSFDRLAYNKSGKVLAVIDAGHNGFYVCGYSNNKVVLEPRYILLDELNELLKEYNGVSDKTIPSVKTETVSPVDGLIYAVENKKDLATFDFETLSPLYVRKSQAEEGRP